MAVTTPMNTMTRIMKSITTIIYNMIDHTMTHTM